MVKSGDWLVPRVGGEPHLTKPPVTYWIVAVSMKAFGQGESAVRLPVAVAYALSVLLTVGIGAQLSGSFSTGFLAGLFQMISPLAFLGAHVVTTDTFVVLFVMLYLSCFWAALTAPDSRSSRRWMLAMSFFLTAAFLTKGPPALLPALAALVFLIVRHRHHEWKQLVYFPAVALFIVGSASWYVAVLSLVPDAISVWKLEAFHKVFVSSNRDMPAYYYPVILMIGALPGAIIIARAVFRRKSGLSGCATVSSVQRESIWFLSMWLILPLLIFMLSRTRLILYVLPLVPAVNILAATISGYHFDNTEPKYFPLPARWLAVVGVVLVALMGVKAVVAAHGDLSKDMKPVADAIRLDAHEHHTIPVLILTMGKMGNGLLYYLNGPVVHRVGSEVALGSHASKSKLFNQAIATPIPLNHSQYVVVSNTDVLKYQRKLGTQAVPVYLNREWGVFRRQQNGSGI